MPSIKSFIFAQLKPFRWHIWGLSAVALIWAVDLSFRPYLIKMIIDRISTTPVQQAWQQVGGLVAIYLLTSLVVTVSFRFWNIVRRNFIPYLKGNITRFMSEHLLKQSYQYYQNNFAGSLANKINDVSYGVAEVVEISINEFLANFLALIIATTVLFTVRPLVGIIFIIWALSFLAGSRYFAMPAHALSDRTSELRSQLTGKVVDMLGNMSIVRLFSRQSFERENIHSWTHETVEAERRFDWQLIKLFAFQSFSFLIMQTIILFYLVHAREKGNITVGDFALIFTLNVSIIDSLWNVGRQFLTFAEQLGKISQGLRITMHDPNITDLPNAKPIVVKEGEICFSKVTFGYQKNPLFVDLSAKILPGQKVGLVGYSGSGKTTFANLILRLFDISQGEITIDGQNIKDVTQLSLRENISLIPQDPTLFHRTLFDNIAYGLGKPSMQEVINAAKAAHAHEFIEKLPEVYATLVGERGIKLSGGQRQRIAIARAILKNAPILILDEATSALDSVTEELIQESLLTLMQNKTTLVIAHRLSTLLYMDRILVFDKGMIIEDGSHEELVNRGGLYASLWRAQVSGFLPITE